MIDCKWKLISKYLKSKSLTNKETRLIKQVSRMIALSYLRSNLL